MTAEEQKTVDRAARVLLAAAAEQKGPQQVLSAAYELLGLPINLTDLVFHNIAWAGPKGFGPDSIHHEHHGDLQEMRRWMRKVKASKGEPIIDEDGDPYRVMCCDVCVQGLEIAKLSMYELRPFLPSDREILKLISGAVACVLGTGAGRTLDQRMGNLMRNLIAGEMDPAGADRTLELLELPRQGDKRVLVLRDLQGDSVDYPRLEAQCFYQLGGPAITLGDKVVCLLEGERDRSELTRFARKNRLCCGLSNSFLSFAQLRDYYVQGLFALGRAEREGKPLAEYRDCRGLDVASQCGRDRTPETFCRPEVLRLWEYDKTHGTDYMETLVCYCQNLCGVTETARASFLHYNTIKYRLKAIREITGMGELQGQDLFEFWLSFQILQLKEETAQSGPSVIANG